MQLTGQNNGGIASSAFLLARKCNWLARTCIMNMRNATCVGTQTSKVPTRVTLLFIPYTVPWSNGHEIWRLAVRFSLSLNDSQVKFKSHFFYLVNDWTYVLNTNSVIIYNSVLFWLKYLTIGLRARWRFLRDEDQLSSHRNRRASNLIVLVQSENKHEIFNNKNWILSHSSKRSL